MCHFRLLYLCYWLNVCFFACWIYLWWNFIWLVYLCSPCDISLGWVQSTYLYVQMMPCVHPLGSRLWAVGLWCVLVMWEETLRVSFIRFILLSTLSLSSLRNSLFSLFTLLLRWLFRWFPWGYSRWFCAIDRGIDRWRQLLRLPAVLWDLGFWFVRDFVWGCVLEF